MSVLCCRRERGAGHEILGLEGDIGGGLILSRELLLPENSQKTVRISSSIVARSVGAGSGGFSRLVCLRIHPVFKLLHAMQTSIRFTAIDGKSHELKPNLDFEETSFRGSDRPNGMQSPFSLHFELKIVSFSNEPELVQGSGPSWIIKLVLELPTNSM